MTLISTNMAVSVSSPSMLSLVYELLMMLMSLRSMLVRMFTSTKVPRPTATTVSLQRNNVQHLH